ncbi:MAG: hypothetical protein H8D45_12460 [Bacteroidetes bacterium]|nr:hypothetical protein [Bacteroidota bacterium]MBL7105641.1 hypothetical protein [Bacteroidales bacterium]
MIKIYIDENFAQQLAEGLNLFQKHLNRKEKHNFEVLSIRKEFGQGVKDEIWIPILGKEQDIVITQDISIQTMRHQRDLYHKYGIGIFFFKPPSKGGFSFWEMVQQIIKRWDDIKQKIIKSKKPFAYRCTSKKGFELLD